MKEKYEITGVLGVSDQYDLDGYTVWGTPWSTPFYPSKTHAGIPANNASDKLDIVTFRWAARDPLNGYRNSDFKPSYFSIQDYPLTEQSHDYLTRLMDIYIENKTYNSFAHLTVGLEADYSPQTYTDSFSKYLDSVLVKANGGTNFSTMSEFSDWYREHFKDLSPTHVIESDDLLGTQKKSIWIQTGFYRAGFVYDYETNKTKLVDLRIYQENFLEPFFSSPNKQYELFINIPYVIDSVIDDKSSWEFSLGNFSGLEKQEKKIKLNFEKGSIVFNEREITFSNLAIPGVIRNSKQLSVKTLEEGFLIIPEKDYYVPREGMVYSEARLKIPFAVKSRAEKLYPLFLIGFASILFIIIKFKIFKNKKPFVLGLMALSLLTVFIIANTKYYISQTELDGLNVLSGLPAGKVLVYDKDCLRCKFKTPSKPAAASGAKGYVGNLSGKETVLDYSFVTAKDSRKARQIIEEKSVDYIYLSKYEGYIETLPYLPKDLGLKRIYENANSAIWKVE